MWTLRSAGQRCPGCCRRCPWRGETPWCFRNGGWKSPGGFQKVGVDFRWRSETWGRLERSTMLLRFWRSQRTMNWAQCKSNNTFDCIYWVLNKHTRRWIETPAFTWLVDMELTWTPPLPLPLLCVSACPPAPSGSTSWSSLYRLQPFPLPPPLPPSLLSHRPSLVFGRRRQAWGCCIPGRCGCSQRSYLCPRWPPPLLASPADRGGGYVQSDMFIFRYLQWKLWLTSPRPGQSLCNTAAERRPGPSPSIWWCDGWCQSWGQSHRGQRSPAPPRSDALCDATPSGLLCLKPSFDWLFSHGQRRVRKARLEDKGPTFTRQHQEQLSTQTFLQNIKELNVNQEVSVRCLKLVSRVT